MSPPQGERRQHPRARVRWPVVVQTPEARFRGETLNISAGGAFIRCAQPPPLHTICKLALKAPRQAPLVADAEVVWTNRYGPDDDITPRGMGVRFVRLAPQDQEYLHQQVERLLAAPSQGNG